MPNETDRPTQPRSLLLATDLSARCDRALDRAAALATKWNAELVGVHALEQTDDVYESLIERRLPSWHRMVDPGRIAVDQLRHDLAGTAPDISAVVERADPTELVLRVAAERGCGLIVTGIARDETLGRFGLGTTVDHLLPRIDVPLLIVRERARSDYRHIVVATDFSTSSRAALETALAFFPGERITLFHVYDTPLAGLADNRDGVEAQYRLAAEQACRAFLDEAVSDKALRDTIDVLVEQGPLIELLQLYVRAHGADLIVVGTEGHTGIASLFLGSDARDVVASAFSDVLVVRRRTTA
jgi:nucleotide-binding universal stress UspA family protein